MSTWQALEEFKAAGKAKSIGVSNFQVDHLEHIIKESSTTPSVNQVELHPAFQQRELRGFQTPLGIHTEAWGPLGQGKYDLFGEKAVTDAADAHGVSPAQVVIRWHLDRGIIVFPKSNSRERIASNFDVFGFELNEAELAAIDGLDAGKRVGAHPDEVN